MAQFIPDDPYFTDQWHLLNTGQSGGVSGLDIGATFVWPDYTGRGVTIAVVDSGVELTHPDLVDNASAALSFDILANSSTLSATGNHGTFVAGILGAETGNALDVSGIAYGATFGSLRILSGSDDVETFEGVTEAEGDASPRTFEKLLELGFDTSNHSYGPSFPFNQVFGDDDEIAVLAYETASRDGLGGPFVVAAGNERYVGGNANHSAFAKTPYDIQTAAFQRFGAYAGDEAGSPFSNFSNPGADLFVTAPGVDITSTDQTAPDGAEPDGEVTINSGTSFSAPIVTGVTALMLEANAGLGGRDVQEILAMSATRPAEAISVYNTTVGDSALLSSDAATFADRFGVSQSEMEAVLETPWDWQTNGAANWNGGGMHVSHDYGFGAVNALAATRLAESWLSGGAFAAQAYDGWSTVEAAAAVDETVGNGDSLTATISISDEAVAQRLLVSFDFSTVDSEDLELSLTSPGGTVSYLWQNYDFDVIGAVNVLKGSTEADAASLRAAADDGFLTVSTDGQAGSIGTISFGSTQHWGESIVGDWTLAVTDKGETDTDITLDEWSIEFYTQENSDDDRYVFTDEFSDVADSSRQTLSDAAGTDAVNAAAVTTGSAIDLTAGATSTIDGTSLTIDASTTIEMAHGGDGADTIAGNDAGNTIWGWRGSDIVTGGAGTDVLYGGDDFDIVKFSGSRSAYDLSVDTASATVAGTDGTDSVFEFERYGFDDREFDLVARFTLSTGTRATTLTRDAAQIEALQADADWTFDGYSFGGIVGEIGTTPVEVYSFLNTTNGAHFYTASSDERDALILANPGLQYEGVAFTALDASDTDTAAVYRLYDGANQTHIYTTEATERDSLDAIDTITYEQVAWYGDALV